MTPEPTYEYRILNTRGSPVFSQSTPILSPEIAEAYRIVKDASDPTAAPHRIQRRGYTVTPWEDIPQ